MKLTPVRNPGKPISREFQVVMSPGKVKSDQKFSSSNGLRAPDEKTKQVSRKYALSTNRLSALERLPAEIMEKIFKLCYNLSLPRSSPVIGARLASWNIYKILILKAFETKWSNSFSEQNDENNNQERTEFVIEQSDILRCRWAVNALLVIYQRWIEEKSLKPPKPIYFNSPTDNLDKAQPLQNTYDQAFFDKEFESFRALTRLRENIPNWNDLCWDRENIVSSNAQIPDRLLLGPWSEETLKKFFCIIRFGASIDRWHSEKGETSCIGLRNAVKDGNIGALYLLLWAMNWNSENSSFFDHNFNGCNLLTWTIRNVGGDYITFMSHLLTLSRGIMKPADKRILIRDLAILENDAASKGERNTLDRLTQMKRLSINLLK